MGALPGLVDPSALPTVLGRDEIEGDLAVLAVDVASAMARSYCRQSITLVEGDVAVLAGTRERRLVLGERPVRAVSAVEVDGRPLSAAEYRWRRSGTLWREVGWGGPEAEVVVTYDHGFAVVPDDLRSVVHTAATRLYLNPAQWQSRSSSEAGGGEGGSTQSSMVVSAAASGFTLAERMVLDRYRRRTWP